jgi:hypothetical protein
VLLIQFELLVLISSFSAALSLVMVSHFVVFDDAQQRGLELTLEQGVPCFLAGLDKGVDHFK